MNILYSQSARGGTFKVVESGEDIQCVTGGIIRPTFTLRINGLTSEFAAKDMRCSVITKRDSRGDVRTLERIGSDLEYSWFIKSNGNLLYSVECFEYNNKMKMTNSVTNEESAQFVVSERAGNFSGSDVRSAWNSALPEFLVLALILCNAA